MHVLLVNVLNGSIFHSSLRFSLAAAHIENHDVSAIVPIATATATLTMSYSATNGSGQTRLNAIHLRIAQLDMLAVLFRRMFLPR